LAVQTSANFKGLYCKHDGRVFELLKSVFALTQGVFCVRWSSLYEQ